MDPTSFDRIAKVFADRRLSRRRALGAGGAGVAAGLAAALAPTTHASAQEATPAATPISDATNTESTHTDFLFLQSFQSGSIVPASDGSGTHTVTLEHGLGQTVYFGDRPSRIVGAAPTERILEQLGFSPENPPNAALVVNDGAGETTIAVVELTNPTFNPGGETGPTVTYHMTPLAGWEESLEMGFTEAPSALDELPESFGTAHLFIDDCPDSALYCVQLDTNNYGGRLMGSSFGHCFRSSDWYCGLCEAKSYYVNLCNDTFPDLCPGRSGEGETCELAYIVGGGILDALEFDKIAAIGTDG